MDTRAAYVDNQVGLANYEDLAKRDCFLFEEDNQSHSFTKNSLQEYSSGNVMENVLEKEVTNIAKDNNYLHPKAPLRKDTHLLSVLDEVDDLLSNLGF